MAGKKVTSGVKKESNSFVDMMSAKAKTISEVRKTPPELDKDKTPVLRFELMEIMGQMIDNVNEMAHNLMEDLNTMFRKFVYPSTMRISAMENLLIEKGILSRSDIDKEVKRLFNEAIERAKEENPEEYEKFAAMAASRKESSGGSGHTESGVASDSAKIEKI